MKRAAISVFLFLGCFSALAAPKKKPISDMADVPYVMAVEPELKMPNYPIAKEADFKQQMLEAKKRGKREIAGSFNKVEADVEPFRNRVLALKDTPGSSKAADELDQILYELEQDSINSSKSSEDLRFFAAQLTPLRSFRGFFHKVRKLARSYPVVQSYLVTMAKQMATNVNIFLTDDQSGHMKVMFRYLSEPYNFNSDRPEKIKFGYKNPENLKSYGYYAFSSESEIQNWLLVDVLPRLELAIERLSAVNLEKKTAVWDNKLIAGTNDYQDNVDRYRGISEGEKNSVLSNFEGNASNILVFCSYSNNGLLALVREMGFLYGVEEMDRYSPIENIKDIIKKQDTDVVLKGASAKERRDKIKNFIAAQKLTAETPQKLFTLLPSGKQRMKQAYGHAISSNYFANLAWEELRVRDSDENMALNGALFRPFISVTNKSLTAMTGALKGGLSQEQIDQAKAGTLELDEKTLDKHFYPIRSAISGDIIQANVIKFFYAPPQSLTSFLPVDFNKEPVQLISDVKTLSGVPVPYRNYFHGTATNWDFAKFRPYFKVGSEGAILDKDDDIKKVLRVTNQSWGGLMIGMSLSSVLL